LEFEKLMGSCSLLAGWLLLFCPCGSTEEGGALTEFQKPGGKISSVHVCWGCWFNCQTASMSAILVLAAHAAGQWRSGELEMKLATPMNC
jgi:hypothetical protein